MASKKPVAYVAVSEGTSVEVYAGVISGDDIKEMNSILKIEDAQSDVI